MYDSYLKNPGFGFPNPVIRLLLKLIIKPLRRADFSRQPAPLINLLPYQLTLPSKFAAIIIEKPSSSLRRLISNAFTPKLPAKKTLP